MKTEKLSKLLESEDEIVLEKEETRKPLSIEEIEKEEVIKDEGANARETSFLNDSSV